MNLNLSIMWCVLVFDSSLKRYVKIKYALNLSKRLAMYVRGLYSTLYPERSFICQPY